MPAAASCACLVCYFSAPERKQQCESSSGTACCKQPRRRRPAEHPIPTFLSEELIKAIEPSPSNANLHLHFPVCPHPECLVSATITLGDTEQPIRLSLPTKPTCQASAEIQQALDAEMVSTYAPWFQHSGPPSLLALRYLRLFCPISFDARNQGTFAQARTFILAILVLTRLSVALSESLGAIYRCWKPSQPPDRREGAMAELSVLYASLVETKRALVGGKCMTLLGGAAFKKAFTSALEEWISSLLPYATELCGQKRKWHLRLGMQNIEQLRFQHWGTTLRMTYEHCNHKKKKAGAADNLTAAAAASAAAAAAAAATGVVGGPSTGGTAAATTTTTTAGGAAGTVAAATAAAKPAEPELTDATHGFVFPDLTFWSFPTLHPPPPQEPGIGSSTASAPEGKLELTAEETQPVRLDTLHNRPQQPTSTLMAFGGNIGMPTHLSNLPTEGYTSVHNPSAAFYMDPHAMGLDPSMGHGHPGSVFRHDVPPNQIGHDGGLLLPSDEQLGFLSSFGVSPSVNSMG